MASRKTCTIHRAKNRDFSSICDDGEFYVAFDKDGVWLTYGTAKDAPMRSGRELAEYLFHKSEIASVEVVDRLTIVELN